MPNAKPFEEEVGSTCIALLHDFAHEIIQQWKGWLGGSLPMTAITTTELVYPDWIHFPPWAWVFLIFVSGLLTAMFGVYRDLRIERDALQKKSGRVDITGPFVLVPYRAGRGSETPKKYQQEEINSDV